jgi:hypothetical protein
MLDQHVIQMRGFKNVVQDGRTTGFQVRVRSPYYRGIWASLLEGATVTVDGETFPPETTRWTLGGKTFSASELANEPEMRWLYEEPVILTVDKPGGLEPGLHDVQVSITWRWSYITVEMQPTTNISRRKLVLVR